MIANDINYLNAHGFINIGQVITEKDADLYRGYLETLKNIEKAEAKSDDVLLKQGKLELIQNLPAYPRSFLPLIENEIINNYVNAALNEYAVIHSMNGLISFPYQRSDIKSNDWHRDIPVFPFVRTSILVIIALDNQDKNNGATEFITGTHQAKDCNKPYATAVIRNADAKKGECYIMDAALLHKPGINNSDATRSIIVLKYTLSWFKQQLDFCRMVMDIETRSEIVKQRLGYNVRVPASLEEISVWKSGQYNDIPYL